jgi:lysophospholipase L1-like esterase
MKSRLFALALTSALAAVAAIAAEDAAPARRGPPPGAMPANPNLPSIILIGDSTVRNGRDDGQGKGPNGQWGWGHLLADYFDPAKINVVNRAVGGLSSRTFLTGGFWERALPLIKPGDFVIMQFGHNDGGAVNDNFRARASLKGVGDETQEIDNLLTKQHEIVHTYGWYLRKFIADTKAKGATPIVCSLIPRKTWTAAGKVARSKEDFAGWAREVAEQEHVGFIDLNENVAAKYDALGHDAVMKLFPAPVTNPDGRVVDEHTHTNWAGAELNAQFVVAGLKALSANPLGKYLSAKAADVKP